MHENYRNICRIARQNAGLTQERFAEQIDVSVESVRLYEAGKGAPSDDVVTRMIEVSGMPVLGYWHLLNKSRIAAEILPTVGECSLPQAVIQLLVQLKDFGEKHRTDELLTIAADGRIDEDERPVFDQILHELEGVVKAAMTLKYAKGDEKNDAG